MWSQRWTIIFSKIKCAFAEHTSLLIYICSFHLISLTSSVLFKGISHKIYWINRWPWESHCNLHNTLEKCLLDLEALKSTQIKCYLTHVLIHKLCIVLWCNIMTLNGITSLQGSKLWSIDTQIVRSCHRSHCDCGWGRKTSDKNVLSKGLMQNQSAFIHTCCHKSTLPYIVLRSYVSKSGCCLSFSTVLAYFTETCSRLGYKEVGLFQFAVWGSRLMVEFWWGTGHDSQEMGNMCLVCFSPSSCKAPRIQLWVPTLMTLMRIISQSSGL